MCHKLCGQRSAPLPRAWILRELFQKKSPLGVRLHEAARSEQLTVLSGMSAGEGPVAPLRQPGCQLLQMLQLFVWPET